MAPKKKTPQNTGATIGRAHGMLILRFLLIFIIALLITGAVVFYMVRTTTVHRDDWNRMGLSTLRDSMWVTPLRGEILAADGSILATNLYYYNVMMDLRTPGFRIIEFTEAKKELADSLSRYFPPYSAKEWLAKIDAALEPPRKDRTRNFVLAREVSREMVNKIKGFPFFRDLGGRYAQRGGLKADQVMKRAYPFGKMARLSIGRVGMTEESSDVHGRSGLEYALDTLLYGKKGLNRKTLSTRGTRYVTDIPAIDGYDITTTIDITMQDILESELGEMLLLSHADWGTAILMEVATGDIKAISNLELDKKSARPRYIEALNRSVLGYEPGSVMKVMSMAVALEKGFAHPNQMYSIGRSFRYLNDRPINDTHSPAGLPVSRFLEYSSNIGMVKMTMPYYNDDLNQFRADLAEMGFFDRFGTGIAHERRPSFARLGNKHQDKVALSRMVFGYSTMIPPLYTCAFYNAVANDGHFVRPRLVKGLRSPAGVDSIIPVTYIRENMMSEKNARTLRAMMREVVWGEGGTAKALKSDIVEIAGKTGTCKLAKEDNRPRVDANGDSIKLPPFKGGYIEGHYRVTFCGFFPYENPKYTCIVVISDPKVPYRGPALSAGAVLKNTALKLYARGMLSDDPHYQPAAGVKDEPVLYSALNNRQHTAIHSELKLGNMRALRHPNDSCPPGTVPDVKGISIREALTTLESHGYAVDFNGIGYVASQSPEAGTTAGPGTKVKLNLRHN